MAPQLEPPTSKKMDLTVGEQQVNSYLIKFGPRISKYDYLYDLKYPSGREDICVATWACSNGHNFGYDTVFLIWKNEKGIMCHQAYASSNNTQDYLPLGGIAIYGQEIRIIINGQIEKNGPNTVQVDASITESMISLIDGEYLVFWHPLKGDGRVIETKSGCVVSGDRDKVVLNPGSGYFEHGKFRFENLNGRRSQHEIARGILMKLGDEQRDPSGVSLV